MGRLMSIKKDLIGLRFNRLLVVKRLGNIHGRKNVYWLCQCLCGNKRNVFTSDLTRGHTRSCGCLRRELLADRNFKHGDSINDERLYKTWRNMKTRCYNPNNKAYKRYGNRGIFVYKIWKDDYVIFKNWALKNGYKKGLTIDRIDNDGNYEPSNCRFIPKSENSRLGARIGR